MIRAFVHFKRFFQIFRCKNKKIYWLDKEKKGKIFCLNKLCSSVKVNLTLQHFDPVNPNHRIQNTEHRTQSTEHRARNIKSKLLLSEVEMQQLDIDETPPLRFSE